MAGSSRTYYRVGNDNRIVAATTTRRDKPVPEDPPTTVVKVNPGVLAAALRLAGGDPSRLVFISPTQVEVLAAGRTAP